MRRPRPPRPPWSPNGESFRSAQRDRGLLPYEALMPGDQPARANKVLTEGWVIGSHPAIAMEAPIAWDVVAASNRSWHYHLHAWDGLGILLAGVDAGGDNARALLARSVEVAVHWAKTFPSLSTPSPFAWYDMAVGLRAYRLAYLIDAAARDDAITPQQIQTLVRSAGVHRDALVEESRFAGHSNHGLYQSLGLLAMTRRLPTLPGMEEAHEIAAARVGSLVEDQFTEEGVHVEHSPGYHVLILEALLRAMAAGLVTDPLTRQRAERAERVLPWLVQSDGRLAMVGDTSYGFSPRGAYTDPGAQYVVSAGAEGSPPPSGLLVFPKSGYAAVREDWRRGRGSYLLQIASFRSRAHKHADDLSFVWSEGDVQLIADAGRYGYTGRTEPGDGLWELGYNYDDPSRVYVESIHAHSTVEINGQTHSRRDATPYGSALRRSGTADGVHFTEAVVELGPRSRHTRLLFFAPAKWVVVVDDVASLHGRPRSYRQRFLFGPDLKLQEGTADAPVLVGEEPDATLHLIPLNGDSVVDALIGAREPRLAGWISRQTARLEPTWTIAVAADGTHRHVFATLLAYRQDRPTVISATVDPAARSGDFTWRDAGGEHRLAFKRPKDGSMRVQGRP